MSVPNVSPRDTQILLCTGGAAAPCGHVTLSEQKPSVSSDKNPVSLKLRFILLLRGQVSPPDPGNQILTRSSMFLFPSPSVLLNSRQLLLIHVRVAGARCDICLMCCRGRTGSETIPAYWLLVFEELKALSGISMTEGDSSALQWDL